MLAVASHESTPSYNYLGPKERRPQRFSAVNKSKTIAYAIGIWLAIEVVAFLLVVQIFLE